MSSRNNFLVWWLEWKIVHCYFKNGSNKGKIKRDVAIANKLQTSVPKGCKLEELHGLYCRHSACQNVNINILLIIC